jgi:hypothetical protein
VRERTKELRLEGLEFFGKYRPHSGI